MYWKTAGAHSFPNNRRLLGNGGLLEMLLVILDDLSLNSMVVYIELIYSQDRGSLIVIH